MRKRLIRLVGLLACVGVASCAYDNPAQPSLPPVDPSAPAQVTIGAAQGVGAQSGTAAVTATVQNGNGVALPNVVVTFATTRGTISPGQAATGVNGIALTTLTASDTADVTASVGTLSAHTLVVSAGTPTSPPAPALAVSFLNVSGSATTGVPLVFSVSSSVLGATWTWSFGDGAIEQSSAFSIAHAYGRSGIYTATVSSSLTTASSATVQVKDPVVTPPGTPVAALGVSLTCSAGTASTTPKTQTACNVSVTYGGANLPSAKVFGVDWDWGDGGQDKSSSPVATHIYANTGTYTIIVNVNANTPDGVAVQTTSTSLQIK